jgi:hypothetical protein
MPYIDQKARDKFGPLLTSLKQERIESREDLAFVIKTYLNYYLGLYQGQTMEYGAKHKYKVHDTELHFLLIESRGELNYLLTKACKAYLDFVGEKYEYYDEVIQVLECTKILFFAQTHHNVVGVLECCKLELYRRLVSKYEDIKILLNGDVY